MCFLLFAFGLKFFPFLRMNANFLLNISFILGKIMYTFSTDQVSKGTLLQGRAWTPNFVPNGEKLLLKNCQNICQSRILRDWHQWACQSFLGVLLPASALQGQGPQGPPAWLLPGPLSAPQGLKGLGGSLISLIMWIYIYFWSSFLFFPPSAFFPCFFSLSQNFRIFSLNIFSLPLEETQTSWRPYILRLFLFLPGSFHVRFHSLLHLHFTCEFTKDCRISKDLIIDLEKARIYLIRCPLNKYNFTHKFIPHEPALMTLLYLAQYFKKGKKERVNCIRLKFQ